MAKKLKIFLGRLESALIQTSSDSEKDLILGLGYIVAKNSISLDKSHFYGSLNQNSLDLEYNRKTIDFEIISEGKKLYEHLKKNIIFPQSPKTTHKKLIATINAEYESMREFFENE